MKLCPFCEGEAKPYIDTDAGMWFVQCRHCHIRTKLFPSRDKATQAWDDRDSRGKPKPLSKPPHRQSKSVVSVSVSKREEVEQAALKRLGNRQAFGVFGTVACQLEVV